MPLTIRNRDSLPSPKVAELPSCSPSRLIDNGLLHYEASVAGRAERYGRGETSHTIHVWWARRPHSAMRALVFASLCKNSDEQSEKMLSEVGLSTSHSDVIIDQASEDLSIQYEKPPKLLDMFGGGGTIPFESLNLGAETYAIDANELSVFIQKCNIVYSQSLKKKDIQPILKKSGERVLKQLQKETEPLYPIRESGVALGADRRVFGYLWTYSQQCKECGYRYFLMKRPWLSKKKEKNLAFVIIGGEDSQTISIQKVPEDYKSESAWVGRNGTIQCPKCRSTPKHADIRESQDEIVAIIRSAEGRGKEFVPVVKGAQPGPDVINKIESDALQYLSLSLPESELPVWSGIVNPVLYGIRTHADFMNRRQRAVLVLLIKALHDEFERLKETESKEAAIYVISLLSSMIDQMVDWNCRLSMWIPQNEQVGRGFCGPGVSMLWDYAEIDPLSSGPSNLHNKLERIIKGSASIKHFSQKAEVRHAYAQELPFNDNFFDAIVTDPPYYDNIYYSVLADFFFAWKRLLLKKIEPDLFTPKATDFSRELVSSTKRNGNATKAHHIYCEQLKQAIAEAARVIKPEGIFSFIYTHSSLNGWEALIRAYRPSKLIITSVQPLSIERKQRPRAMTSQAVNTCLTFVARKYDGKKAERSLDEIVSCIEKVCTTKYIADLVDWGWSEYDAALAVFAHGVGILANTSQIVDSNDIDAMVAIEQVVKAQAPSFKVVKRKSL